MSALLEKLQAGIDLNRSDVKYAVTFLLTEAAPAAEKAAILTALHEKGETTEEIAGFVEQLIDRAVDPMIDQTALAEPMIDVCGTGGSSLDLFNVSTTIMFILAAGGATVVKHGNRSVTSCCGSADVIEALGIRLVWTPQDLNACVQRLGLGFIYAREYHPAFRALAEMRAQLARAGTRTVFNLLGPLLNPARPPRQLIGVYAPRLTKVFAEVLRQLKRERAWVVHGSAENGAGMDNISTGGATTLAELNEGRVTSAVLDCRWLGITAGSLAEVRGATAAENAKTLTGILSGDVTGAKRDLALVNAGGAFVVAGLAQDLGDGISLAREQIDSGRALQKLRAFQDYSAKTR
ncbi:MAG: anthranilate phosphoribosyltransferase [Chthoniobacterales bacterium]|nr:anthranilate phosphoribosyltransferase [Chthoniobacterales bacterium]